MTLTLRPMGWILVAIWSIYSISAVSSTTIKPTAKDYPPPPWPIKRFYDRAGLIPLVPAFRRAEEFMLQTRRNLPVYPAAWNLEDRIEIIFQTWIKSRAVWNDPRARRPYDTPEGPFYHLLAQQAAESEFDRNARSPANADGSRDLGLTQQNDRYLSQRGITDWRDIEQQTTAQASFMNYLLQQSSRFGGERARRAASAGYTAGPRWARRGEVPDIGRTRAHVAKIERYYQEMLGPAKAIPAGGQVPGVYVVQPGDTLWKIARGHGSTVARLAARNGIADPDLIQVGQRLNIQ